MSAVLQRKYNTAFPGTPPVVFALAELTKRKKDVWHVTIFQLTEYVRSVATLSTGSR